MTTEDLQERYKDKTREIKPKKVPLAADSAHLLTEYLDSISVEFVRKGVMEPYRITREYEEILVQELQKLGSKNKLTYEITSKLLEKYGTPQKVVEQYISENDPPLHQIFDLPSSEFEDGIIQKYPKKTFDIRSMTELEFVRSAIIYAILIGIIVFQIFFGIQMVFNREFVLSYFVFYLFVLPNFIILEVISSFRGTGINRNHYHKFREFIRFSLNVTLIMGIWWYFNTNTSRREFDGFIILWLITFGIGLIKDHTDLLLTSAPKEKPIARFILPSYIFFGISLILLTYNLYKNHLYLTTSPDLRPRDIFYATSQSSETFFIIAIAYTSAAIGLLMEYNRKYPLSIKKLGYQMLLFIFPVFRFSFRTDFYEQKYLLYYVTEDLYALVIIWGIVFFFCFFLVFRKEIKTQLTEYKQELDNQLDKYQNK